MRGLVLGTLLTAAAGPALAQGHAVTVVNGGTETVRAIVISPQPGTGENRLRSTLPPGATARITYSTGCQANLRIGFESGRTEDYAAVDVCSDPRIVAGQGGGSAGAVASVAAPPAAPATAVKPATPVTKAAATATTLPAKAPPPVVPPWTGKSITKRFGGMD